MSELTNNANDDAYKAQQRKRSIAIGLTLFALVVMFYVTAWIKFGSGVGG